MSVAPDIAHMIARHLPHARTHTHTRTHAHTHTHTHTHTRQKSVIGKSRLS